MLTGEEFCSVLSSVLLKAFFLSQHYETAVPHPGVCVHRKQAQRCQEYHIKDKSLAESTKHNALGGGIAPPETQFTNLADS